MEFLKCPDCGAPLYMEISEIRAYNITADGHFLIESVFLGPPGHRTENNLLCKHCGREFIGGSEWSWEDEIIGFYVK